MIRFFTAQVSSPALHTHSPRGEVAQLVEHTTENRSVDGSIPPLATNFSNILEGFENRQS
jgi:hypothetical protein